MKRSFRVAGILALFLLVIGTAAAQTPTPLIPASTPLEFNQQIEPAALIGSYYNAITLKDYSRAYAYWEQAPGGRTEAQFAAGFADTTSAHAIVRLPIFADAGAGNIYAHCQRWSLRCAPMAARPFLPVVSPLTKPMCLSAMPPNPIRTGTSARGRFSRPRRSTCSRWMPPATTLKPCMLQPTRR